MAQDSILETKQADSGTAEFDATFFIGVLHTHPLTRAEVADLEYKRWSRRIVYSRAKARKQSQQSSKY